MEPKWTLQELVAEVAARIAALPAPRNGQVRAVPDDRTVRYYGTLGLLDRPAAMRGRTALYGRKHAAQVVAIKRLQSLGRSLSEIQALWPTLDDPTLARMSGVSFASPTASATSASQEFWKRTPLITSEPTRGIQMTDVAAVQVREGQPTLGVVAPAAPVAMSAPVAPVELRVELAPGVVLMLAIPDDAPAVAAGDVRAIRAAAAPLLAALAARRIGGGS